MDKLAMEIHAELAVNAYKLEQEIARLKEELKGVKASRPLTTVDLKGFFEYYSSSDSIFIREDKEQELKKLIGAEYE